MPPETVIIWRTPHGERVLRGAEWELARAGLEILWDWVESFLADPDLSDTGTPAFDRLRMGQKLALLASVGTALGEERVPHLDPTVNTESTAAAVFRQVASEVEKEIDQSRDPDGLAHPDAPEDATHWRLVLTAYRAGRRPVGLRRTTGLACASPAELLSGWIAPALELKSGDRRFRPGRVNHISSLQLPWPIGWRAMCPNWAGRS